MQRLLGTPSTQDVRELAREIVGIVRDGRAVLLTGAQGTGKSAVLQEVRTALAEDAVPLTEAHDDASAPSGVLVADDLVVGGAGLLRRVLEHEGGVVVGFESGRHQRAYATDVLHAVYGAQPLGRASEDVQRFHLDPLTEAEMTRFLHEQSPMPLDSAAVDAVTALALGRRSWALDLLQLHAQGQVQADPHPSISATLSPGDAPLPALQRLRRALGAVPDDCAAAAVALSEVEPLDELAIGALIDAPVVEALTRAGILVPLDQEQHLTVPGFVAAALRHQSPLDRVEHWRQRIAAGLLAQASLGLPISEREAQLCARAWTSCGTVPAEVADVHRDLVVRTISRLTAFGTPGEIRAAVLASTSHRIELPTLARARAIAALGNPREALAVLDDLVEDDPASTTSTRLVRHVLAAQASADPGAGTDRAAELVLHLWNRTEPLGDDVVRLRRIAAEHADPLVATLAALLVDVDAVWDSRVPPYTGSVMAPRPLPASRLPAAGAVCDAASAALVAQGLVLLLAGESAARRDPLLEVAARLPDVDYHRRWLRHMVAAGTAATFGEIQRSRAEWERFAEAVPRLLPLRLRHLVDRVGAALTAVAESRDEPVDPTLDDELPYRVLLYFAGLHGPLQRFGTGFRSAPGTLALVRLARAHLDAAGERNPARLVRIAEHFETYQMWLPSAYALRDARRIYLGRRAVGRVRECDEALARIHAEIDRHAPWREAEPADVPVTLTPRELVAARLAAQGLRNREIAERLECGVRTVESHLAQARAKLGATTRAELARLLPRLDPL